MDIDNVRTTIAKGTIVQTTGLASEAGKALNGGHGIILKEPSAASGDLRYPVLLYALQVEGNDQIIQASAPTKSIKATNLQIVENQKQQLFRDAVLVQGKLDETNNHPGALPWYEAYYERWPDGDGEIGIVMTYVELLRHFTKEPKKALEVISRVKEVYSPSTDKYDQFLCMYVEICCSAGERIEEALDHALQIPTDREQSKMIALRALSAVLAYSSEQNEQDATMENPAMFDVQLRTAKGIYELYPTMENLSNLGAAYCLNGNNLEGAKCYRRAMASGEEIDPAQRKYREGNLIAAQMQCPGMPLEDYIIIYDDGKVATCIKRTDKEFCQIGRQITGFGMQKGSLRVNRNDVDLCYFPLPSSPDDPDLFPRSFLDTLAE